jgi:histone H3/H4
VGKLLASLTAGFKVESEHRESIKQTLRKFPGTLMTHVNNLLDAAAEELEASGRSLLLIIDNMDRYDPKMIDGLLVQSADRFKALRCHMTVTPPIDLVLRPESQSLESVFHCETMPTVKLRERGSGYWNITDPGREILRSALARRIDIDRLIPSTQDQDRLITASGGAIRELLEMARDATLEANGETITGSDIERVLERRRQRYRDRIDANGWWDALAKIAKTKRLSEDEDCLQVLFQRLAFQYNGELWYDVHPLISDLPDFQSRVNPPAKPIRKGRKRG